MAGKLGSRGGADRWVLCQRRWNQDADATQLTFSRPASLFVAEVAGRVLVCPVLSGAKLAGRSGCGERRLRWKRLGSVAGWPAETYSVLSLLRSSLTFKVKDQFLCNPVNIRRQRERHGLCRTWIVTETLRHWWGRDDPRQIELFIHVVRNSEYKITGSAHSGFNS